MIRLLKEKINLLAIAFCAASSCFWMLVIAKWYYFRYTGGWDTAYFIQTLWGISHGKISPSVLDASFMADHCHFFAFLLAPLHWIYPDPLLLQDIKILGFFAGSYLFFLILKKYLSPWIALGAMIAFTIAPANVAMLRFAFSYEALSIPLVFLVFKAFDDKKYGLYIISCFLLMMVKEQMPLVVMGVGLLAFFIRKEERMTWGIVPIVMGLTVFVVEVFVLLPLLREQMHVSKLLYWTRYIQFGKTPHDILFFLLTHPGRVWTECFSSLNIRWYNDLFGVWGVCSFLSPLLLLPVLPLYLKMALSSEMVEHSVVAVYYASVFTPFVFLAAWNTLNYVKAPWRLYFHNIALLLMLIHALSYMPLWVDNLPNPMTNNLLATQKFIGQIPSNASVLSCRTAMTFLANRDKLYQLKDYFNGYYYVSGKKFVLLNDIDDVLIDFTEFKERKYTSKIAAFNFDHHFRLKESIEDVALFERTSSGNQSRRLIEKGRQPFSKEHTDNFVFEGTIALQKVEFPQVFPMKYRIYPVTMYWQSLQKTKETYDVLLKISKGSKTYYLKRKAIGSSIYPTTIWNKGEYIKEDYFYLLPRLEKGEYTIEIQVYNSKTNQPLNSHPALIKSTLQKKFVVI
ncbi:MAG: DUF2079 domain-containing protein [Candidatus Omnitrophica bacterium]|nr:DUF2079 domain-containing protein [Candidatus Omnitrophota bacterium]